MNYINPHLVKTSDKFEKVYNKDETVLSNMTESMRVNGFDMATPLIIWKEKGVLIDGHTRLRAAIAAQVARVPYVLESFGTEADVIAYMRRAQLDRRNLTDADKIHILLNDPEYPRASNKKAYIASVFRCSVRTAAKYSRIMNSPEELKAVLAVSESDETFIMKKQARTDTDAYITYAKRLLKVLPDKIDRVERKLLIQELKLRLSRLLRSSDE